MNEPPGLPSTLGIEAVEWLGEGAESLTVRVSGRWPRRRPTWTGQPLLVIEIEGLRHRYPAMPEPPSLTGAAPGTWQMSFAVPASVATRAGTRAWLQLGSVVVPLPVPVEAEGADPPGDETLRLRRVRAAEVAVEASARRVAEAQAEAQALETQLDELEGELERATALAAARARDLRAAQQRAHAERALRQELEERLAEIGGRQGEDERDLRIAELERELERLRQSLDEAEHAARSAMAARRRAERRVEEALARAQDQPSAQRLDAEFAHSSAAVPAPPPGTGGARERAGDAVWLRRERRQIDARSAKRLVIEPDPALGATLAELRSELGHLRAALEAEAADREQAEERVARAYDAIQEVRDGLEQIRSAAAGDRPEQAAGAVEAERLTAALERLRESAPPPDEDRQAPHGEWLAAALRPLARRDTAAAARVLGALLPAPSADARVAARLLAAGRVRRRLRRGAARVRGRRQLADSLDRLLRTPVSLGELLIDARSALLLAAAMIDPNWSRDQRFTIAYDSGPYLHVRGADRPLVSDATLGAVATTIVCGPQLLTAVLSGERPAGTMILGDREPLELVQAWLERAQSG
jgi:hypothetical protein